MNTIQELLTLPESHVGKLISKAQALEALNDSLKDILEAELYPHCRIGGFDAGVLTLFTHNAAIATRLRYSIPTILSKLRAIPIWAGLCQIQIKIHQQWHTTVQLPPEPINPPPLKLSTENAKEILLLVQNLQNLPGMERLVASLMKIANHAEE
ncbi:MAG: DUF721 domain-containing protein [Proteobacteria bacterium]|nr:DUF721 domain-containing protein [Pseudomonadota bacterium]